ncbi:MAG: hypothetical protein AMS16_03240 [Planctomycetes bacterium DG_58]|nr:MAG: hypothetical protein AMS16_03240 [Planctomycetes bacterium DG_58]
MKKGALMILPFLAGTLVVAAVFADWREVISDDGAKRAEASQRVIKDRREVIRYLLLAISSEEMQKNSRPAVVAAIELLGEIRASEAVTPLADLLLYGATEGVEYPADGRIRKMKKMRNPRKNFPVVEALIKIGNPSLDEMARVIAWAPKGYPGAFKRFHARIVITEVLGYGLAAEFLRLKSTQTAVDEHKKRLLEVRDQVLKIQEAINKNAAPPE